MFTAVLPSGLDAYTTLSHQRTWQATYERRLWSIDVILKMYHKLQVETIRWLMDDNKKDAFQDFRMVRDQSSGMNSILWARRLPGRKDLKRDDVCDRGFNESNWIFPIPMFALSLFQRGHFAGSLVTQEVLDSTRVTPIRCHAIGLVFFGLGAR